MEKKPNTFLVRDGKILVFYFTESEALAGIGNLAYFAAQEDDPYITLKGDVSVAYSGSRLDRFYSPYIEIYIYRIGVAMKVEMNSIASVILVIMYAEYCENLPTVGRAV